MDFKIIDHFLVLPCSYYSYSNFTCSVFKFTDSFLFLLYSAIVLARLSIGFNFNIIMNFFNYLKCFVFFFFFFLFLFFVFLFWFFFFFFFFFFLLLRAALSAYGGSQARGLIGAVAAGLRQSHSNAGSQPRLQPTPQLTATPDRQATEWGQELNLYPHGY